MNQSDAPTPNYVTCPCQHCSGKIEFDASHAEEMVACPHCGLETKLYVPIAPLNALSKQSNPLPKALPKKTIIVGLCLVIAICALDALFSSKPMISGQIDDVAILSAGRPHPRSDNPNHVIGHSVEVETVGDGKITCGVYETEYAPETYSGQFMLDRKTYIKSIVIYHYPNPKSLVTGQIISGQNVSCRGVRVANYFSCGISREAYDYRAQ